jgi:hypothetical protein
LFFREAQFLVILPGKDVAHDMEFHYKLHPTKYEPVATIATNFCHWLMNGADDEGNSTSRRREIS